MKLHDAVVLITGASSGIGEATAIAFAKRGAKIVINYRENGIGAAAVLEKVKALSDGVCVQADVSTESGVRQLFQEADKAFDRLDILINNAAIPTDQVPFMDASYADFKTMIDSDLLSVFMCSQAAAKIMLKQGYGKILNTSSIRGWEYGGRAPVYAAAKAGVNSFTRTFAKELAPTVHVNAVAPGFVRTRVYDSMPEKRVSAFIDQSRLKRWIEPDEIADAFIFLAENDAMTGQVVYVEAGAMLG